MVMAWLEGSLEAINDGQFQISVCRYDKIGTPVDNGMLSRIERDRPDCIIYTSQADGPFVAAPSTFKRIREYTRIVHLCLDAGDVGFTKLLTTYRDEGCFDWTVACDGCAEGPVDNISFHPVDPRPYGKTMVQGHLDERAISLGTCGGFPYDLRREVADTLIRECGLYIKPREETWGSYQRYANFLQSCRIVVDCALSAGGPNGQGPYARTLKTRAIEVGLSGACLLELRGCALTKWATEDVDFCSYETAAEAVEKARWLMANPDIAQAMATNLALVVRRKMNPTIFWSQVFSACGLDAHFANTIPTSP